MISKLCLLAVVAPLVSALTLNIPQNPKSGTTVTISWTTAAGDPDTFSLELINQSFNNAFAIGNNIDPAQGSIDIELPVVPVGDGYTLEAVNIGDISQVYSTTGDFAIGATSSASVTSTTTGSTSSAVSSATSLSSTGSTTRSATTSLTSVATSTKPLSTATGTTSTSASASAASNTVLSGASSKHAMGFSVGAVGALIVSGFAGAAFLAL